jgi:hypothetical protein
MCAHKRRKPKKILFYKNAAEAIKRNFSVFTNRNGSNKPIARYRANGINKTFDYHFWRNEILIPILMEPFNYSPGYNKAYLGISQDDLDDVYRLVE